MATNRRIPILLFVDVEPDLFTFPLSDPSPWHGFEACYEFLSNQRSGIEKITGAPAHYSWSYRMDPQIEQSYGKAAWPVIHYRNLTEDFLRHGDDLGLHPHADRWDKKKKIWISDRGNQEWVNHCVVTAFEAYKDFFGFPSEHFRFGSRWISCETLKLAESYGARFDTTCEPGHGSIPALRKDENFTGILPDFRNMPRVPYQPSIEDFRIPSTPREGGLWIIPLTTGQIQYRFGRMEKFMKNIIKPHLVRPQTMTLNPAFISSRNFSVLIDQVLNNLEKPYLAMAFRTSAGIHPEQLALLEENLKILLEHPLRERFVFMTSREAMANLGYIQEKELLYASK